MSDASMPNQASEPNQEVGASQQAQVFAPPNSGGSAVLDADIAAGVSTNPEGEPIAHPIATNFSSEIGQADAKTADASTIAGPYSTDGEQREKGRVNLHNNPDVADSNAQGTLPNTDPVGLPLNSEVNLPE
ncbi:MAG TPA: hypothetical protein V6D11_03525 [Waterburya sp.]|jgi:hypothetical protein